jgi:hypothetical protein
MTTPDGWDGLVAGEPLARGQLVRVSSGTVFRIEHSYRPTTEYPRVLYDVREVGGPLLLWRAAEETDRVLYRGFFAQPPVVLDDGDDPNVG